MVAILFAGTTGLLDDVKVEDIRLFEDGFHKYLDSSQEDLLNAIAEKKALDDDLKGRLKAALEEFKGDFLADHEKAKGSEAVEKLTEDEKKQAKTKTVAGEKKQAEQQAQEAAK